MAGKNRWSIGALMIGVIFVASNCAVLRAVDFQSLGLWVILIIPMVNMLAFGLIRLKVRRPKRRFWTAFEIIGWPLMIFLSFLYQIQIQTFAAPFNWLLQNGWLPARSTIPNLLLNYLVIMITYTIPPLMICSLSGWFWEGYRLVIVRPSKDDGTVSMNTLVDA